MHCMHAHSSQDSFGNGKRNKYHNCSAYLLTCHCKAEFLTSHRSEVASRLSFHQLPVLLRFNNRFHMLQTSRQHGFCRRATNSAELHPASLAGALPMSHICMSQQPLQITNPAYIGPLCAQIHNCFVSSLTLKRQPSCMYFSVYSAFLHDWHCESLS